MNTTAASLPVGRKRLKLSDLLKRVLYRVPAHLRNRWRDGDLAVVKQSIDTHYHKGWRAKQKYSEKRYQEDLRDHLYARLYADRANVIPWLDSVRSLNGLQVLEVGSGTGASTVALAEQGAHVTGIDIDEDALTVARDRCHNYGVTANLQPVNVMEFAFDQRYEFVIFFACLEHMTIEERLRSLRHVWDQMQPGALLAIVETPNRLWYFDSHTSRLDFFNWLPDELAFHYSRFSTKGGFCDRYRELTPDSMEHFLRRGRGVSYHEFDIAIGKPLNVVSSRSTYRRLHHIGRPTHWAYKALLKSIHPGLHDGFYEPMLFLVIEK